MTPRAQAEPRPQSADRFPTSVVELGPADEARWEKFLAGRPDALIFHHPAWLEALRAAQGYDAVVLGHLDRDGALDGVLPLMSRRGWATGRRLISLPHTPVAGPLAVDDGVNAALASAALERSRADGARLELKTREGVLDGVDGELGGIPWSTTFALSLPGSADAVRFGNSRNHGRIKWSVGKAAKAGVELREASSEQDLRRWHALYLATMRSHAVPPRPYRFFAALWTYLRPRGFLRLLLAEQGGELLAGSVLLMFGSTVFYAFNGRRREALNLRPNDLIQWHAIRDAADAGYARYDFGEVESDQRSLADFKSKWGARPESLIRYLDPPSSSSEPGRSRLDRPRHAAEVIWRRVPLPVTARIGDVVYRRV
jgi:CelD/BcsL family acetyltransferase involved in cellulose biosynthesis